MCIDYQQLNLVTKKDAYSLPCIDNLLETFRNANWFMNASGTELGAVLVQKEENGKDHAISYTSRGLSQVEKNYLTTEQECLAILWPSSIISITLDLDHSIEKEELTAFNNDDEWDN
ncbi:7726_t:CDS:2, partial [Cetraspora pellucida]